MIKIKEEDGEEKDNKTASIRKIHVTQDNNEEEIFNSYPIIIKSKDIKHLAYEIQKTTKTKTHAIEKGRPIDKVKEKTKDVKDKVIDITKDVTGKTKDTVNQPSLSSSRSN